jgi:lipoprotein-releasing system permease protein
LFRPLTLFVGLRYATVRRGSQLVSFLSGVSILGLVMGVALLVVVLSVMSGFDKEMRTRILAMVPQASIMNWAPMVEWELVAQTALATEGVEAVAPFIKIQGMLIKGRQAQGVELLAVDVKLERTVSVLSEFIIAGEFDSLADNSSLLLSQSLANKLRVKLNDSIALVLPGSSRDGKISPSASRFTVTAIFKTDTEIDNSAVYISLAKGQQLAGYVDSVEGVQLKVSDLMQAREIARKVLFELPNGYYSRDWTISHGNLYEAIQMSRRLVSLLLFIIIAVAAFNVVTALFMVVNDKRSDIAVWQTMGMPPAKIMQIFLIQGLIIGVIGTSLGVLLGLGLALSITDLVAGLENLIGYQFLKSDIYPVTYLPSDIRWQDVSSIAAVALVLSIMASIYPAWRASKLQPADSLRYDA